jgi:threonine efflux protein
MAVELTSGGAWQALVTIALLHAVVLVTPGANFLLIGQMAASGQQRQAVVACVGITCVTATWATLAVWGLGAVVAMHPALQAGLPLAGGIYLLYVATGLWRSSGPPDSEPTAHADERSFAAETAADTAGAAVTALSLAQAFRRGFVTNILNPKTALFFSSVFGSILPAQASAWMSAAAVGVVYVNALIWHLFLALAFSRPAVQTVYVRHRSALNRVCGTLVAVFAGRLLWSAAGG